MTRGGTGWRRRRGPWWRKRKRKRKRRRRRRTRTRKGEKKGQKWQDH